MADEMVLVSRETLRRLNERATRSQRGCTDEPEYLQRDLDYIADSIQGILDGARSNAEKNPWFDIDVVTMLAAAKMRWPDASAIGEAYWVDPTASLVRVGVALGISKDVAFGANYNYRERKFE